MQKNTTTPRRPTAGQRTAHLTLSTVVRQKRAGRKAVQFITHGTMRFGRWSIELDNPTALGELTRCMLATRIALHSASGELLTNSIVPADLLTMSDLDLPAHEVEFLGRVMAGFSKQPFVFHVVPRRGKAWGSDAKG